MAAEMLLLVLTVHCSILAYWAWIRYLRFKEKMYAMKTRDIPGCEDFYELSALLNNPTLTVPERHYIINAYHPRGKLWLDDINPNPIT